MKIEPKASPNFVEGALHKSPTNTDPQSPRERAIAKLLGTAPKAAPEASSSPAKAPIPDTPVPNPTQISPEELGAIKPSTIDSGQTPPNAAAQTPEVPKETPKPTEENPPLSAQYAQLARKEKAIRAQAIEIKRQQDALKAQEQALKSREAEMQGQYVPKERLTKETLAVLAESGISYDKLTELALQGPSPAENAQSVEIAQLKAEIKALRDDTDSTKKSFETAQKQSYDQAIAQIGTEVRRAVYTDPQFETIKATNSSQDVVDLIVKTFEEGLDDERPKGTLLSAQEAAEIVEEYLVEEAIKIAKLKKIQDKLKPAEALKAPAAAQPAPAATAPKQQQTLTNNMTQTRNLSARDRAVLAFQGKLGKE